MNDFPKCYLLSSNQGSVVSDMFYREISKEIISLNKVKNCQNNVKQYHLFYYQQDNEIDWWLSYAHPPRLFGIERSSNV